MGNRTALRSLLVMAVLAVMSIALVSASPAIAAKGGIGHDGQTHGKGGKGGSQPPASTTSVELVSANPVPVGTAPTFLAKGFQPGSLVYMSMTGYMVQDYGYADSTGSITYTWYEPLFYPATYTFTISNYGGANAASVSFTAQ